MQLLKMSVQHLMTATQWPLRWKVDIFWHHFELFFTVFGGDNNDTYVLCYIHAYLT